MGSPSFRLGICLLEYNLLKKARKIRKVCASDRLTFERHGFYMKDWKCEVKLSFLKMGEFSKAWIFKMRQCNTFTSIVYF